MGEAAGSPPGCSVGHRCLPGAPMGAQQPGLCRTRGTNKGPITERSRALPGAPPERSPDFQLCTRASAPGALRLERSLERSLLYKVEICTRASAPGALRRSAPERSVWSALWSARSGTKLKFGGALRERSREISGALRDRAFLLASPVSPPPPRSPSSNPRAPSIAPLPSPPGWRESSKGGGATRARARAHRGCRAGSTRS